MGERRRGRRYLDLGSGIAVTNIGHRHPHVVEAPRARCESLLHTSVVLSTSRTSSWPRPRRAGPVPRRPAGVPLQQRRRGGRRRHQAGPPHHRPARDHRLPARLPRPHDGRHDAHHRQGQVPRGLRAAPAGGVTIAPYAYPLRHGGDEAATALRTGGPRRAARAAGAPRDRRGDDRRAGARRGRLRRAAGRVAAGPARALRRARHPARVRRGADAASAAPAARSPPRRSAWPPTSCCSPRASRRACRSAGSSPVGPSWTAGRTAPTAPPSAATRCRARPPSPPSRCSRTRASTTGPARLGDWFVARLRAATASRAGVVEVRGIGLMIGVELADADKAAAVQQRCLDEGSSCSPAAPRRTCCG